MIDLVAPTVRGLGGLSDRGPGCYVVPDRCYVRLASCYVEGYAVYVSHIGLTMI